MRNVWLELMGSIINVLTPFLPILIGAFLFLVFLLLFLLPSGF